MEGLDGLLKELLTIATLREVAVGGVFGAGAMVYIQSRGWLIVGAAAKSLARVAALEEEVKSLEGDIVERDARLAEITKLTAKAGD